MNTGIYEIRNKITGQIYIGSSYNIRARWRDHRRLLNKNIHCNRFLQNSWNKYTEENFLFKTLLICNKKSLILYEQIFIDFCEPEYNICKIAGNTLGVKSTEEQKLNRSMKMKGIKRSVSFCKAISERMIGNKCGAKRSQGSRNKLSDSMKCNAFALGYKRTEESKLKASERMKVVWVERRAQRRTQQVGGAIL